MLASANPPSGLLRTLQRASDAAYRWCVLGECTPGDRKAVLKALYRLEVQPEARTHATELLDALTVIHDRGDMDWPTLAMAYRRVRG